MFEATLHAADPQRQQRLMLAAAIAVTSTTTMLAGFWTLERLGIDRVIGPSQRFELLQFSLLTLPKSFDPPPPPPKDPPSVTETASVTTPSMIDDHEELIEADDEDPVPSDVLTQPRQGTEKGIPDGKSIRGGVGCPSGICGPVSPFKGEGDPCIGPLCTGSNPPPPKQAAAPSEVEFSALRCLACADPDQSALRKTVAAGQKRNGRVEVKFCVDTNGRVEGSSIKVSRSFGLPAVDQITTSTMKRWRFTPLEVGGKPRRACSRAVFNIRFE